MANGARNMGFADSWRDCLSVWGNAIDSIGAKRVVLDTIKALFSGPSNATIGGYIGGKLLTYKRNLPRMKTFQKEISHKYFLTHELRLKEN